MLHGNNMPRAQANVWLYLGLDTMIPKEILDTQFNWQITTTENLSRSILEYQSPDVFELIVYLDDHGQWPISSKTNN